MSFERSIEITGDSIEDAIAKGLAKLGVGPSEVIVEVLDEPKAAMFGMDARPARVRLQLLGLPSTSSTVISTPPPPPRPMEISQPVEPAREREERPRRPQSETRDERDNRRGQGGRRQRDDRREDRPSRDNRDTRDNRPPRRNRDQDLLDSVEEEIDETLPFVNEAAEVPEAELDDEAQVAKIVVNELLERMDITAKIVVRRAKPDDEDGSSPYILDIMSSGNSGRLVGRRGETLAALQYISRLITSRELQRRSDIIVDANSYKARRAQSLSAMALRMADEAVTGGKVVTLEPMPPHERRIVHLALRGREDVSTRSVGEGTARKVTIVPGKQSN